MINFIKHTKKYFAFSLILILISISAVLFYGLNFGIEFTGGSVMEIEYEKERPSTEEIRSLLSGFDLGEVVIQPAGDKAFVLRMKDIPRETYAEINLLLEGATENYFESIGPAVGEELKDKALVSIVLASIAIVLYIAVTFYGASSRRIKSWQYGLIAAGVGFFHDVLIVIGLFAVMGYLYGIQVTIPIAVALLTVLGYSINDTVVIFDRIRENLPLNPRMSFGDLVNKSLNETIGRSLNTSLTTLIVLFAIFFVGGETIKWFVFAMIVGISIGTYSSIFIAGPLLVYWFNRQESKNK